MSNNLKSIMTLGLLLTLAPIQSEAGQWVQDFQKGDDSKESNWRYVNDDGTFPIGCWLWIDGNQDGIAECYYFSSESETDGGYMLSDTVTPDGYSVNSNGAWTVDGNVQRLSVPVPKAGTVPSVKKDSELKLIGCSLGDLNEIYGSANISKLTESSKQTRYSIKNENITVYVQNGTVTAIEVPLTFILDDLPITCSYIEFENILLDLGFELKQGEYGVQSYTYNNYVFTPERNRQYNIGQMVHISK